MYSRFCLALAGLALLACDKDAKKEAPVDASDKVAVADASVSAAPPADASSDASTTSIDASIDASKSGPCPDDMAYVDTNFCPDIERECLDVEHEHPNNLTICHRFKEGSNHCKVQEEKRQFCIDRYEYPNKAGAHPTWNVTWYEAQASCKSRGKRLCWGSEWTAACEGPEHTPFPYGWVRDHDKCNIDSFFIDPRKVDGNFLFSSKDPAIRLKELSRLDQSVPSGSMPGCKSGFGVYDLTGNMDEWIISDMEPQHKSKWSGFKGGAWGHVRSACRPQTFSHQPDEWYYFWSFRCCKDAEGAPSWKPPHGKNMPAPEVEAKDYGAEPVVPINPPGPSKTKYGQRRKSDSEEKPK